jgi:hypothetical protein
MADIESQEKREREEKEQDRKAKIALKNCIKIY